MNKFIETAKRVSATVMLITGFVLALGAALQAFSNTMNQHYNEGSENKKGDENE